MTLQEAKDQVAFELFSVPYDKLYVMGSQITVLNQATILFAREACREQREICATRYDDGQPVGDHYLSIRGSIKNAPEPILT